MAQKGHCFCGVVEIEVEGAPEAMGYCHCESCRSWSAGPVNAFSVSRHLGLRNRTQENQWLRFGHDI